MNIGSRRELFLDRHLIESSNGTQLVLHEPMPGGVALRFDLPWEGKFAAYPTILHGANGYQLYYRGEPEAGPDGNIGEVTCYAESKDGIHWTKPELGLFMVMGKRNNNVIGAGEPPFSHNFSPFIDTRPGVPPEERYKALAGVATSGLHAFVSADGVHWRRWQSDAVFRDGGYVFDSQNVSFWSESEQRYVLYYRKFINEIRTVARSESTDFVHWSQGKPMEFTSHAPISAEQLYTNQTQSYFRAPHMYIALAARFMPERAALGGDLRHKLGIGGDHWQGNDCSDAVLMSSRGGYEYDRTFPQAFIRPGADELNWTSRNNYPALGIIPCGEREMSIHVQRNTGWPSNCLERMTLRLDGFASVRAEYETGEMLTRPLIFKGERLELNYATSAAGCIRVEIQDADGKPLAGFGLNDCRQIMGDEISRVVSWTGGSLSQHQTRPIRLRFQMKEADLYSIRFEHR
ncbi:MAG: hypothetical protein IT447_15935 [Phycisphaerales bacterium]|jgi:hypothetical protein|nr:hypothetical protein [Phycisphaerales bacterium]